MAQNLDEMKDVFMSGSKEEIIKLYDYIKNDLGIEESGIWNYIGYSVICVDPKEYEYVLSEGKKYASDTKLDIYWIDYYNERRAPINSSDVGYGILPKGEISGEDEFSIRAGWRYDEMTPVILLDYFDEMKKYLGVDEIIRKYNSADGAITISSPSLDYENQSRLFKEFIYEYGCGPFEEIYPLTFTGEFVNKPLTLKKTL